MPRRKKSINSGSGNRRGRSKKLIEIINEND